MNLLNKQVVITTKTGNKIGKTIEKVYRQKKVRYNIQMESGVVWEGIPVDDPTHGTYINSNLTSKIFKS